MDIHSIINTLSLREKLSQMFIMGFDGTEAENNVCSALKNALGGVIFFSYNINSLSQLSKLIFEFNNLSKIPPFISIDQEGGLVERTINAPDAHEYLTQMSLSLSGKAELVYEHTKILSEELRSLGVNMNFSPVIDVNTEHKNPVIGVRSFSDKTDEVIKYSEQVLRGFEGNNIIAVGKHFPGHGATSVDSHIDMPQVSSGLVELENIHIKPFKELILKGLDAVMIAHVNYSVFDNEAIPASLSKNIVKDYLISGLGFKGLVITDDMMMGGITEYFSPVEGCIKAINAGIDVFIMRNSTDDTIKIIDSLCRMAEEGQISEERINESVYKILSIKNKYNFFANNPVLGHFDTVEAQNKIDKIALQSLKILKKGRLIPLQGKSLILSPDKKLLHNFSDDSPLLSEILKLPDLKEISYSVDPSDEFISSLKEIEGYDNLIFVEYNSNLHPLQLKMFNSLSLPAIVLIAGNPYNLESYSGADSIIQSCCYKTPLLKAFAEVIKGRL